MADRDCRRFAAGVPTVYRAPSPCLRSAQPAGGLINGAEQPARPWGQSAGDLVNVAQPRPAGQLVGAIRVYESGVEAGGRVPAQATVSRLNHDPCDEVFPADSVTATG